MKRKRRCCGVKFIDGLPLEPTSSLNDYFMCVCSKKYSRKVSLLKHIENCNGLDNHIVCRWCNLEFKNRGNLVTHAFHMHGDTSLKRNSNILRNGKSIVQHKCEACNMTYSDRWKFKYHIRRLHYNLWAKIPLAESKQVNQVWFEKVLNTNLIMQIKKTGLNTLLMKPVPPNAGVKVHENNKRLDLRSKYPTGRRKADELCKICLKIFRKVDLAKHMNEMHFNLQKHKCNNCQKTFKRSYIYLQHVCHKKGKGNRKKRKVNGVKQQRNSLIRIASVASLKPVVID